MGYNGEHNKTEKMKDFLELLRIHCSGWSKNKSENKELVKLLFRLMKTPWLVKLLPTLLPYLFLNGCWVKRLKSWVYHITGLFIFLCILVSCNTCNQIYSGNNNVFSVLFQMGISILVSFGSSVASWQQKQWHDPGSTATRKGELGTNRMLLHPQFLQQTTIYYLRAFWVEYPNRKSLNFTILIRSNSVIKSN